MKVLVKTGEDCKERETNDGFGDSGFLLQATDTATIDLFRGLFILYIDYILTELIEENNNMIIFGAKLMIKQATNTPVIDQHPSRV